MPKRVRERLQLPAGKEGRQFVAQFLLMRGRQDCRPSLSVAFLNSFYTMAGMDGVLKFFDPFAEIDQHGWKLPHWQQAGACYFVTFRLADSIPQELLKGWLEERELWLARNPKPWSPEMEMEYHRRFSGQIEEWLDAAHGECVLKASEVSAILKETLMFADEQRYLLHSWVVMPNHVHGLFSSHPDEVIHRRMKNWKGISSRRINQHLGGEGKLWQRNYFDRLIRDQEHFRNVARYIRKNPIKAGLKQGEYRLYESDYVREILA